ncbi:MAG: hypothetical protein HKN36_14025 [Hellea sp.]|nr:hypothetical protein [Hellea sp.]
MKKLGQVFWRMGIAYLFYPVMIGLFIWIEIKDFHWIFGAMVIAAILIIDPIWAAMGKNAVRMWKNR